MLGKIAYTFIARLITAAFGFLLVVLTSNYLGAAGRGEVSLVTLALTISMLINNFVGGSALVYLTPRTPLINLIFPSYVWAIVSAVISSCVMLWMGMFPVKYFVHILILSIIQSFGAINLSVYIGLEKVRAYNLINLFQGVLLVIYLFISFFVFNYVQVEAFVYGQYVVFGFVFLFSLGEVVIRLDAFSIKAFWAELKTILYNSFYIQIATLFQLFNYRFSFFLLDKQLGKASVGIYSTSIAVAESVWLISKSIVMIQYSRVVNTQDHAQARKLTLDLMRLSCILTVVVMALLLIMPLRLYLIIFGAEFYELKHVMLYLLPGVFFISVSTLITHYYAGIGKNKINTMASFLGFVVTAVFCFLLIPKYHLIGAALAATLSYGANTSYLFYVFMKDGDFRLADLVGKKSDWKGLFSELTQFVGKM